MDVRAPHLGATEGRRLRAHVLYIEDDDVIRQLYGDCLREAGLTVQEERSADHALEILGRVHPDVILLDLGMPAGHMSGIEMLARLRDVPDLARIPVVVLSGFVDVVNPDIMARLSVSHVLSKTAVHGSELVRVIADLVQRQGRESDRAVRSNV
jgi:CheY-like chemotaxis protein